ncbi:MAG: L-threonylcarbamoyladenylate synthase [Candidatus Dojkabacteria bacterium]|nr:L-threonylcarbamoyladenylate synthase [Candidatus Dojkabacteria bacterium]
MSYLRAEQFLNDGGVVIFPTDTVMGVGCRMDKIDAITRLYKIKRRPASQPTAVLASDIQMARNLMKILDPGVELILEEYWPGALTVVVKASITVPSEIMGEKEEVGIRVPDFARLQLLISNLGVPLLATSANFKGEKHPIRYDEINPEFIKLADYVIEEDSTGKTASTIIRYNELGRIEYIRKGGIIIRD